MCMEIAERIRKFGEKGRALRHCFDDSTDPDAPLKIDDYFFGVVRYSPLPIAILLSIAGVSYYLNR